MAKKIVGLSLALALLLGLGVALWSSQTLPQLAPVQSQQAKQLDQAIADLQNPKKIIRRYAVEKIARLSDSPDIGKAVQPLSDILLNLGKPSGIFTQMIAAETLGRIAAKLGPPASDEAVEALIECLENEGFDVVRAACAQGLGLAQDELSVEPLLFYLQNDQNPLVKLGAQAGLQRLDQTRVPFSPESKKLAADLLSKPVVSDDELYQYIKAHTIYARPALEERGWRP